MHNPYELYEGPGVAVATQKIDEAIKLALHKVVDGKDPYEAYKQIITPVLNSFVDLGSCDSEPQWHAAKKFANGCGQDPDDFYAC